MSLTESVGVQGHADAAGRVLAADRSLPRLMPPPMLRAEHGVISRGAAVLLRLREPRGQLVDCAHQSVNKDVGTDGAVGRAFLASI